MRAETSAQGALPRATLLSILRIVLLYAVFAGLWILLSDRLVAQLFPGPSSIQFASTLKGLAFVAVTSVLLFFLVLRFAVGHVGLEAQAAKVGAGGTAPLMRRSLIGGVALLGGVFILLAAGGIVQSSQRHRAEAGAHLQSIASLRVSQIEAWVDERRRDAQVVGDAQVFKDIFPLWRKTASPASRQRLLTRMEGFRRAMHYEDVWLTDEEGNVLLQIGPSGHVVTDELRRATRLAMTEKRVVVTDLFRVADAAPDHVHLDVVAPLGTGSEDRMAQGTIILRVDVRSSLFALLKTWPVPSASAETLLFRREGGNVLFLNELRHEANAAMSKRVPLSDKRVLAVQALEPGYRPGDLLEGIDYRGVAVIGVAQPVAHASWTLIAKADREELLAAAASDALWIAIACLLVLLATGALAVLVYQRRELQYADRQRFEQGERLRALRLLDAIISSSTDAIFAKDEEGRYLLFNAEAARVMGMSREAVLGRDDRMLFPPEQAERIMADDRDVIASGRTTTFQETLDTADGKVAFLATKGPLRDTTGRVFGLFGISRDITKLKQTEEALQQQTRELLARNQELERFNRVVVGRELDMIVLKRLVNNLSRELGRAEPFNLDFVDPPGGQGAP